MTDEPIDFSPLDPSRDPRRWQLRIEGIVTATMQARQRRSGWVVDLHRIAKPALAVAASIALVSWYAALKLDTPSSVRESDQTASRLLTWAANDEVPPTSEILETLGVQHGPE